LSTALKRKNFSDGGIGKVHGVAGKGEQMTDATRLGKLLQDERKSA
jgi:hypothetical protein